MRVRYRVRISATAGAVPETAAVRLIAALPPPWAATLINCDVTTTTLEVLLPKDFSVVEAVRVVDEALTRPGIEEWSLDRIFIATSTGQDHIDDR